MSKKAAKIAVSPVVYVGGTLKGAAEGVLETSKGIEQIIIGTGTQGAKDVYDLWTKSDINPYLKGLATPFSFVYGTVKGVFGGVRKTFTGIVNTGIKTAIGGPVEVLKMMSDKKPK